MNYRHTYHAGNHGDVLKHAILAESIRRLREKPTPFFVLDTHAGIGMYDLTSVEAGKTEEFRSGIEKILAAPPVGLEAYLDVVHSVNAAGQLDSYPGSPAIAATRLRSGDRLVLAELHPQVADVLRRWARGLNGVSVHLRDGYESIRAFLPPPERRGLVIVDPPFEAADEYQRLGAAITAGHRRWPGGRWLIWHPIKDRTPVWKLHEALLADGITGFLSAELLVRPADGVALAGSGVILINPPFGLDAWLEEILPALQNVLAPQHGSYALRRVGE